MSSEGPADATRVNYYDILQVSPTASQEVIQAAYRALARGYHPDVNPDAQAASRMLLLNKAYDVLGDSHRRAAYDLQRARASRVVTARPADSPTPRGGSPADPPTPRGGPPAEPTAPRGVPPAERVRGVPPSGRERATAAASSPRGTHRAAARRGASARPRLMLAGVAIAFFMLFVCLVLWAVSLFIDDSPTASHQRGVAAETVPLNRFLTAAEHPMTTQRTESGHDALSA